MRNPTYLGDGAYVHMDELGNVVLTTAHHEPAQAENIIVLDTGELEALLIWLGIHAPITP